MHSSYETAGVKDLGYLIDAMVFFFSSSLSQTAAGEYTLES
jgi:aspartyl aminopeptidase